MSGKSIDIDGRRLRLRNHDRQEHPRPERGHSLPTFVTCAGGARPLANLSDIATWVHLNAVGTWLHQSDRWAAANLPAAGGVFALLLAACVLIT